MIARRIPASTNGARIGLLLTALAMFVRMVVPAGFMPMPTLGGLPSLVLCSGSGPVPMAAMTGHQGMAMPHASMGHDHDAPAGHDGDSAKHGCFLAAVGAAIDVAVPPVLLRIAFVAIVRETIVAPAVWPGLGLAAPPPPKTGPPSFR